jgi:hypothetical protein
MQSREMTLLELCCKENTGNGFMQGSGQKGMLGCIIVLKI